MSANEWTMYYEDKKQPVIWPEGFVVRILTSSRPMPFFQHDSYRGKALLDLSCGIGRNLPFLKTLGFQIQGTEISLPLVEKLRESFPDMSFFVGWAHSLPFSSGSFDVLLSCNTCYYIPQGGTFEANLREIERVLRPGGVFIGTLLGATHSLFDGAERLSDGSCLIKNDQEEVRNETLIQGAENKGEVEELLRRFFTNIKVGHQIDDCFGFCRDIYYFTAEKS